MASKEIVFTDRVVGLSLQNGLVRMDLAVVGGRGKTKDDKPAVKLETTHQLVMPLDAFVAAVGMQQNLVKELAKRQKARREAKGGDAAPAADAAA